MRLLKADEKRKRGCIYCENVKRAYVPSYAGMRQTCPYTECPYTVLDKYDTYEDFMKSDDSKIRIADLLGTAGGTGRFTACAKTYITGLRRADKKSLF